MMPFPRLRRFLRDPSGTAALEFALIALPLILFTFGIIEIGRALFMQQQLFHATDMAARLLYIAPNTSTSALEAAILDDIFLGDLDRLELVRRGIGSLPVLHPDVRGHRVLPPVLLPPDVLNLTGLAIRSGTLGSDVRAEGCPLVGLHPSPSPPAL